MPTFPLPLCITAFRSSILAVAGGHALRCRDLSFVAPRLVCGVESSTSVAVLREGDRSLSDKAGPAERKGKEMLGNRRHHGDDDRACLKFWA